MNKLETGVYKSVPEFEADVQLIWDNCEEYNGDDSGKVSTELCLNKERKIER